MFLPVAVNRKSTQKTGGIATLNGNAYYNHWNVWPPLASSTAYEILDR